MARSSAEFAHHVPIILGTPTTDRAIKTLKESENRQPSYPMGMRKKEYSAPGSRQLELQQLGLMLL